MEGKNKKTKVFKWAAVMMLAAMMIVGCKQAQGSSSSGEENKKTETPVTPNTPAAAEKYAVSFKEATLGGKLTAKVDGGAITTGASVEKGKTVTFTAAPIEGYEVEKWELNGKAEPSEKNAYELKVSEKAEVKVYFKEKEGTPITKYEVTVSAGSNGKVTVAPEIPADNKVPKGQELTITATAKSGYVVEKWTVTPAAALQTGGANGSDTATAKVKVTANTTVNVTFKQQAVTPPPPPASADKTYTVGGISFTMKEIAAVTNGTLGHADYYDNAVHTVSLTAYRIGETEVTQELWQAVMGENPSWFKGTGNPPDGSEVQEKRPVESVNWYHAIAFCNKLSKACGLEPCYTVQGVDFDALTFSAIPTSNNNDWNNAVCDWSKNGFRLPTEAEWEWAAMGGTEHKWAGTNVKVHLINYAWYSDSDGGNANNKTHEVKKKQANGYGLYDMSGNVWEWCWDWYHHSTPTGGQDPTGASSGVKRVIRGGSWNDNADFAARAVRAYFNPDMSYPGLGLRVACRP